MVTKRGNFIALKSNILIGKTDKETDEKAMTE
jgi:hypothetical protein